MGVTRNDFYVAALRRYLRNLREMEVERILDRIGGAEKAMPAHLRA
ncbi:MAG TPA: hypothetical protein VK465_12085 [Fibrobacteria bacterium]|nr:hypothetical protein [Fibrobacteria bacterium]